ncbi:TspO/MBR family protein [Sphingomonas solaris]|uniref:Tryptophan-rich sensory protein n=1 Tax=Alterirhizorhabdus solaris TaxID=2529389 RepID=A0A558RBW1_9SPHN|nr:TspO/MBR family protein [Sphingomonas solaris]TVV76864.1 tryptophan-rich sensory protein [Sphingomonas solaris]
MSGYGQIASKQQLRMAFLRWAIVIVPAVLLLGILSGRLANSGFGNPWFDALVKPSFMPPGWAFGLAWTILYVLIGFAFAMIVAARGARRRGRAIGLFLVQLALNLAWSPIFFAAHQVTAALALILVLIVLVAVTTLAFARIRPVAGTLMLPYLAWLLFAAALNFAIMQANPGAETLAREPAHTQISL